MLTAEHDPLRDEGECYGECLRAAGVPVTIPRAPGAFHGFFNLDALLPLARDEQDTVFAALRTALHDPSDP